jgi:hypothetical protein
MVNIRKITIIPKVTSMSKAIPLNSNDILHRDKKITPKIQVEAKNINMKDGAQ